LFFLLLCLAGAFQLYRYPSRIAEVLWEFIVFFLSMIAFNIQYKGMQQEMRELGIP
jgi:prolipoprotein diacylglyceryltransferase